MIPHKLRKLTDRLLEYNYQEIRRNSLDIFNNIANIQTLHPKTFDEFYNCNYGKDVVIVASGPTVKEYNPIPNAIHIGINNAYKLKDKITFKYMFMQDYNVGKKTLMEILNMDCIKFIGRYISDNIIDFSENEIPEGLLMNTNPKRYFVLPILDIKTIRSTRVYPDIRQHHLIDFGTTVHTAIHFALFTNPKRIFLVGCDTSQAGHFDVSDKTKDSILIDKQLKIMKTGYLKIKEFAIHHYPDTEIISINPVGLKGFFIDKNTDNEN